VPNSNCLFYLVTLSASDGYQLNGSYRLNRRALTVRRRRVTWVTGRHHQRLTDYSTTSFRLLLPVQSDDNEWQLLITYQLMLYMTAT